ncbi:acylneuraminate cytidylyltransferase family protein [Candidatus Electrothrix sp.]|uniref:acylneuraminate cytidylyltransferase family protein n=1 Tax=Candidatus Electrothrix sp. TaxID=2170559 RepID=UPI0040564C50
MYHDKRILAVVPARGGSKGIPLKNIHLLAGKPLIAYTGDVLKHLPEVDRAVVSTDHDGIADLAEQNGIPAPFRRPPDLSGDRVADWDVLLHALQAMEAIDSCIYDIVLMLQPTCPLRTAEHVRKTFEKLIEGHFDSVWTLSPTDSKAHPLKQLILQDGNIDFYDARGRNIISRQQLEPVYHRNGASYAITRSCILEQRSIMGQNCGFVVIYDALANIDTLDDIRYAEFIMISEHHDQSSNAC